MTMADKNRSTLHRKPLRSSDKIGRRQGALYRRRHGVLHSPVTGEQLAS